MSGRYEAQTLRGLVEFLPHEPNFANSRRPILFEELLTILVSHFYRLRDERNKPFKFSTWHFFRRLTAEKIAGKMIQDDHGKRGQPGKKINKDK